jgi:dolichol-phosphate mannosyltransferase
MPGKELTVVIPTWNEAANIGKALEQAGGVLEKAGVSYEILVMDDASRDGTDRIVGEYAKLNPNVRFIAHPPPAGFGYSIRDGIRMAAGEAVVIMMADLSDDPSYLPEMLARIKEGCDVVVGSRFLSGSKIYGYRPLKYLSNRLFNLSVQLCFLTGINDTSNAYKMFRTRLVSALPTESRSFTVSAEMMLRMKIAGHKICQIPVTWADRTEGTAKFRLRNTFYNYFLLLLGMMKLAYIDGLFKR